MHAQQYSGLGFRNRVSSRLPIGTRLNARVKGEGVLHGDGGIGIAMDCENVRPRYGPAVRIHVQRHPVMHILWRGINQEVLP